MAPAQTTVSKAASEALAKDFPKAWIFDTDGDTVEGEFIRITSGQTRDYGRQPIAVLNVNGTERAIWCMHTALASQFRDCKPQRGDIVAIQRSAKKVKGANGFSYYPFKVVNVSRPEAEADWSIFGDQPNATLSFQSENDQVEQIPGDEDIPF